MAIDPSEASHSIVMASLLGLVAASISTIRMQIIRQDKAIKQLQEQLNEPNSRARQAPAGDVPRAAAEG